MPKSTPHRGEAESLAAILRTAAQRSGLSVYEIAKESGVDQSTLNKFLKGDRANLRLDVADRLLKFLRLRVVPTRLPVTVKAPSGRRKDRTA
jgi:transcriptional regulator with XRE-family HTH domain